ncbi:MAG: TonB-dependent receptor domain-containing protein, partial [Nitrospirales bacterium]
LEFMPINVTKALLQGFESELAWFPTNNVTVRANFTYTRGKDLTEKDPLSEIPAIRGLLGIDYFHAPWGLTVGGRTQITGDQNRVANANGGTQRPKTGGYALFDIYLAMQPPQAFFNKFAVPWLHGLRVNAGIDNLTDLKYRRHLSLLPEAGINPKVSMAYTFVLP